MTEPHDDPKHPVYKVPEWDDYECQSTGRCCHGWVVDVDEEHRHKIERALQDNPHPKWGKTMPLNEKGDFPSLQTENGHCPYLTEDGLCWLHREFDGDTKPETCQSYPRQTTVTPLGTFKTIRISCVTSTRMLADEQYSIEPHGGDLPTDTGNLEPFRLDAETPLEPRTYQALENAILSLLSRDENTLGHRLGTVGRFLRTISRRLDAAPNGAEFRRLIHRFEEKSLPSVRASAVGQAQIIDDILEYRKEFIGQLKQLGNHHEIVQLIERLNDRFGFASAEPETVGETLLTVKENRWNPSMDELEYILEHYLKRKIWAKNLTYPYTLIGGVKIAANLYALVRVVAMVIAVDNDTEVQKWQLLEAIVTVERCFTHSGENQYLWREILNMTEDYGNWYIPYLAKLEEDGSS